MNQKTVKLLRRTTLTTIQDFRRTKRDYLSLNQHDRAKIKKAVLPAHPKNITSLRKDKDE